MKRDIINDLTAWKDSNHRKPLLLTGVRQCGKTHTLKEFGTNYFKNVCYINFEAENKYSSIFDYDFDTTRIINEISLISGCKITEGETLLILDEIQETPRAITALKYFCENKPELHIACAGSLLGVALNHQNISFPVGKVNRMQMLPMSFREFVTALDQEQYLSLFAQWPVDREIPASFTKPLERLLKEYYLIGGMPEVVKQYADTKDYTIAAQIQDDILADYSDDFAKHAPTAEIEKIRMIWDSVPKQLAKDNNKFVFSHVKEGKRAHELEGALQWLKNAGLVYLVELVSNAEPPLAAYADATYFKVYAADIGLLSRRLGLSYKQLIEESDYSTTFKGAVTENYVHNELINLRRHPYFWRSGNSAELDFLFENDGEIIPIEVKSATNTQAKSYRLFCKKYKIKNGFKLSLKNIATNIVEGTSTTSLPLYLAWNIENYF